MAVDPTDVQTLLENWAESVPEVERQARVRYESLDSYQANLHSHYEEMHHWYYPHDGDQWPADRRTRPGKIHMTANFCRPVVEIDARLQSRMPRVTLPTTVMSAEQRKRAEATEQIMLQWLDMSGIDVWLMDFCRARSLYGKGVLKPYWDDDLKRGDVHIIENPANLRIGWGSNDYTRMDWAIYEYSLSVQQVTERWPHVEVRPSVDRLGPPDISVYTGDHADPLAQKSIQEFWRPRYREFSDYEKTQVRVWDYWYKHKDGTVCNAIMVNGLVVEGPHEHTYMPDIPYIVIENDHEPGSPEGISTIENIIEVQSEYNRLLSHGLQYVADEVDPAYQIVGEDSSTLEAGIVPKAGEAQGMGLSEIKLVPKGAAATFPIREMMDELWTYTRRATGIGDIAYGEIASADIAGRALAIQIESMKNRLDPRRDRLFRGLRELLVFWTIMAERKNPSIEVSEDETAKLGDLVRGFRYWRIVAPELTPRDNYEHARLQLDLMNGRMQSRVRGMDEIGIEAPEHELQVIQSELNNIDLNPEAVQAKTAIYSVMLQIMQQQQELAMMIGQTVQQGSQPANGVLAQAQGAQNASMVQQQAQQPSGLPEDMNTPQPTTQAGMAPPAGAPAPGATGGPQVTSLIRQGQPLQQIAHTSGG